VGQSYLKTLIADSKVSVGVGNVTFEPGCRNNWHIHRDGFQLLLVTGGEGWYQEEGKPAQFLKAGDVIVTHDGVNHWHGATKGTHCNHCRYAGMVGTSNGRALQQFEINDETVLVLNYPLD
jgi:quercetin dioxygenase-like cupin family protein